MSNSASIESRASSGHEEECIVVSPVVTPNWQIPCSKDAGAARLDSVSSPQLHHTGWIPIDPEAQLDYAGDLNVVELNCL